MANTIRTCDLILKEFKRVFKNNCPFISAMPRYYDGVHEAYGAKSGEPIRIPKPVQYSVRSGKTMDIQNYTENQSTLTKSVIRGIDLKFSWAEAEQDLEGTMKQHVRPAAAVLASTVENYCLDLAAKEVYNAVTLPVTNLDRADIIMAGEVLSDYSAPMNDRYIILTTAGQADLLNENSSIYNPTAEISRQYTEGYLGRAYGFSMAATPNVASITNTADNAGAVNGASQTGATLTVDNFSAAPIKGMIIQSIGDDVFGLNPVTQASLGKLQKFVINDTSTTTSLAIAPSITATGNNKTVSAVPDNDDVITFMGSNSTAYPRMIAFQKDAFAFGTVDVRAPQDLTSVRNSEEGLAMTFTTGGDIINMDTYHRLDIQFGFVTHIPQFACQIFGV